MKGRALMGVAAICILASACERRTVADREADLLGTITRVDSAAEGARSAVILVEAQPGQESGAPSAYVAVTARTPIYRGDGTSPEETARAFALLTPGRVVRVWLAGPVRESHPLQGTAERIVVLDSTAPIRRVPAAVAPDTRRVAISIEGMEESLTVHRYRSPPAFPLEFTTWVPEDMLVEPVSSGEGDAIRFVANFGGVRNDDAVLAVHIHRADATDDEARALARGSAGHVETVPLPREELPVWAVAGWRVRGGPPLRVGGTLMVGNRAGRWFSLINVRPGEYGDGWHPRAAVILEGRRWGDGSGLN